MHKGWAAQQNGDTSRELVNALIQNPPQNRIWHLAGVHTRGDVVKKLGAAGLNANYVALYDQVLQDLTEEAQSTLSREKHTIVPLFSPRTAKQFASRVNTPASALVIAISSAVAEALEGKQFASVDVAEAPNAASMRLMIEKQLQILDTG